MCLDLLSDWKEETEKFRDSSEILTGYKILEIREGRYLSVYHGFEFKIKESHKSSRIPRTVTEGENRIHLIGEGFHFYKDMTHVRYCHEIRENGLCPYHNPCNRSYARRCHYKFSWFEFEIQKEDLAAVGKYKGCDSFVATGCKLIGEIVV